MSQSDAIALGQLLLSGLFILAAGCTETVARELLGRGRWRQSDFVANLYPVFLFAGVFFGAVGLISMFW